MKINNKILFGIIALLVLLNISIIVTILYKKNQITKYNYAYKNEMPIQKKHLGRLFKNELDLSFKQHKKFQELRHQYHQNSNEIIKEMKTIRSEILQELGKNESDTLLLKQLSKRLGEQHIKLKDLTIKFYLDMKKECSPEQKEKLFELFKKLANEDGNFTMPQKTNFKN